ncbi:MAG: two-component regulator propeller domain-containing protein [Chryseolinea sp.]
MKTLLRNLLLIWCVPPLISSAQTYHFEKLSEFHGLSDNRVTCFQKDRTGFVWIGTENGLNRYDGHTFEIYRPGQPRHALSHEHINDIEEDSQGNLWVSTWGGLNVINPVTDSLYIFLPDEDGASQKKTRIASSLIWDSHIDQAGRVWLAIDVRDLCYYDPIQKEFIYFPWHDFVKTILPEHETSYRSIHKIIRKSDHELWLGTTIGLFSFNINTKTFQYHGGDAPEDFIDLHYDSTHQRVYFGQEKLYVYDVLKNSLHVIKKNLTSIPANLKSPSTLLLSSLNGLWAIDKNTEQANALPLDEKNTFTLQHEKVSALYRDRDITWIGTSSGISIYDRHLDIFPFVQIFPDTSQSIAGNVFYVLDNKQSNTYYISSYSRNSLITLNQQNGARGEFSSLDGKPLSFCTKIIKDSKQRLWILSAESIFVSDEKQHNFKAFPLLTKGNNYRFVDMMEDQEGNFWFASLRHGAFKYYPKTNTWIELPKDPDALFVDRATALLSDPQHNAVWIADFSFGVFRYDLKTKKYDYFGANTKDPKTIQSSLINSLTIDKHGDVWIATTSGGVSKYSQQTKSFTTFSMKNGLPENTIHSVQADVNGNIWLASSKGLTCVKPSGEIIQHYDANSGLPFTNFTTPFSTNEKGEIMIGLSNGFLKFHPDSLNLTSADFPIVITSAHQGNSLIQSASSFRYNENEFAFQFSALTYSLPKDVTYYYQLEGFNDQWTNAGNDHQVRYTNLSDGDYTFSVKAVDHTGKPSQNIASISFTIHPPFWKESWFIALMFIVAGSSISFWIISLQRKIQSQKILNQIATSLYNRHTIEDVFRSVAKNCVDLLHIETCEAYLKQENGLSTQKVIEGDHKQVYASTHSTSILIEGKTFGIIDAHHSQKNFFSRWHVYMLNEIASICSAKIGRYFIEEQIRSKVARDLHDDIGSTLSSINIISKLAMNESNGNTNRHLQSIGEHSAKMMESMSDIVWSINPNNDSLEQMMVKMKEFAAEILEPKNISYTFQGEESLNGASLDIQVRKNIFLIFKETINNTAKYSDADQVTIQLEVKDNALHLFIHDNGKGFDFESIKPGNGLRNIRERAKSIDARLDLRSSPTKGTQLEMNIPIT